MASTLKDRVLAGNLQATARAASLIENGTFAGSNLLDELFAFTGHALTIGITGSPGAGKSTLVDQLTRRLRAAGKTVAIIAVDPSSPYSTGALLGDRIRMQDHFGDPGVFIRSMATRGYLGGLAQTTFELAQLFDAAGRDVVIIETVGVGQDEVDVVNLADVTIVVLVPGMGDDIQATKAGILEIADVFVINKSDLPGADLLEKDIRNMQSLAPSAQTERAAIFQVIAAEGQGIGGLLDQIWRIFEVKKYRNRAVDIWSRRLRMMLVNRLLNAIPVAEIDKHAERVALKTETPREATEELAAVMLRNEC